MNPQDDDEEFKAPTFSKTKIDTLLRQLEQAIKKRSDEITESIVNLTKYKLVMIKSSKDLNLDASMNIHH